MGIFDAAITAVISHPVIRTTLGLDTGGASSSSSKSAGSSKNASGSGGGSGSSGVRNLPFMQGESLRNLKNSHSSKRLGI